MTPLTDPPQQHHTEMSPFANNPRCRRSDTAYGPGRWRQAKVPPWPADTSGMTFSLIQMIVGVVLLLGGAHFTGLAAGGASDLERESYAWFGSLLSSCGLLTVIFARLDRDELSDEERAD